MTQSISDRDSTGIFWKSAGLFWIYSSDHKLLHFCPLNIEASVCTERASDCGQAADASVFICVAAETCCTSGRGFPKSLAGDWRETGKGQCSAGKFY